MLLAMNTMVWFVFAVLTLWVHPSCFLKFNLLFWGAGTVLYAGYPWLPGKSGWLKGLCLGILISIGMSLEWLPPKLEISFDLWGWMIAVLFVCFWLGFDLRGIVEGSPSEATGLLEKLGIYSIGKLYTSKGKTKGVFHYDISLCSQCHTCWNVCPKGVFDLVEEGKYVKPVHPDACLRCGACVCQCPKGALKFL
jgi:NAD-dependent dihydropyrimidine dehydrogenase PreA subunit